MENTPDTIKVVTDWFQGEASGTLGIAGLVMVVAIICGAAVLARRKSGS